MFKVLSLAPVCESKSYSELEKLYISTLLSFFMLEGGNRTPTLKDLTERAKLTYKDFKCDALFDSFSRHLKMLSHYKGGIPPYEVRIFTDRLSALKQIFLSSSAYVLSSRPTLRTDIDALTSPSAPPPTHPAFKVAVFIAYLGHALHEATPETLFLTFMLVSFVFLTKSIIDPIVRKGVDRAYGVHEFTPPRDLSWHYKATRTAAPDLVTLGITHYGVPSALPFVSEFMSPLDPPEMTDAKAFRILSLPSTASVNTIKRAYKALMLQHHPDKGGDAYVFMLVQKAYQHLIPKPSV